MVQGMDLGLMDGEVGHFGEVDTFIIIRLKRLLFNNRLEIKSKISQILRIYQLDDLFNFNEIKKIILKFLLNNRSKNKILSKIM
jgi:hypothetical protein